MSFPLLGKTVAADVEADVAALEASTYDTGTVDGFVVTLSAAITDVQNAVDSNDTAILALQSDKASASSVTALQTDVGALQTDVTSLQTNATSLQTNVNALQSDKANASDVYDKTFVDNLSANDTAGLATKQGTLTDNGGEGQQVLLAGTSTLSRIFAGNGIEITRVLNLFDQTDPKHNNIRIQTAPRVYFCGYNNTNSQPFTTQTRIVNINATRNASTGDFTLDGQGQLLFNTTGLYHITFRASTNVGSGSARNITQVLLQQQIGSTGAWQGIAGTKSFIYNRDPVMGEGTASGSLLLNVAEDTKLRIAVGRLSGAASLLLPADGCSLTVFGM